ncbi:MAG TPA: PEP-CTERM sorting domain-containing protein, partial [Phenylobacterium sp.]|nr:PEP-CTERM sorting domain-containing protein [Phenylobacterium sp.]
KYSFEVVGGHVGDIVPLLIATTISTISSAGGSATVQIGILTSQGGVGRTFCASVLCSAANFSGTLAILAASGSVGTLGLNADVGGGIGPLASSADADPFIFVDPSFANAGLYSIVVSEGVGNALPTTSPVPEPSSWLLLIGGFTGVAALRRGVRRRSRLVSTAA